MQINDFRELDFEIDELTSSIQNAITGEIQKLQDWKVPDQLKKQIGYLIGILKSEINSARFIS